MFNNYCFCLTIVITNEIAKIRKNFDTARKKIAEENFFPTDEKMFVSLHFELKTLL